jgi:transglutaminase-like putative cysteine protease
MPIGKVHSVKKVTAQVLLLALPTVLLGYYFLWDANQYFKILQNEWLMQGSYFAAGICIAIIFYSFRFRFITTAAILGLVYYGIYKFTGDMNIGEFDAFYASVHFKIFATLFSVGWVTGYGFSRSRYYTIGWSVVLLALQVVMVSETTDIKADKLIAAFIPVLAYSVYIIYTAELIRNMNDEKSFGWFVIKRMFGFAVMLLVILTGMLLFFKKDFKAIEKEWDNAKGNYDKNKGNSESMTHQNKDGSISNKDQTRLTGSLNKGKQLVFVAKLDNFFQDGKTPNPLYFTAYYFTKFDTLTQTFERDPNMPYNDLFSPNPAKIPLYFAKTDSTVLKNTGATALRKVVSADIYKVLLSPDEYLAPSTSFFCQPIPVGNEYKDQFKSAYRAKMWVSDLNSAYFIYNPAGNKYMEYLQKERFDILRGAAGFSALDKKFLDYYTFMPGNEEYNTITTLAKKVTANAKTPVDKMLAIREYFLSKDEFGQPMYKYTNNPGIPGLPSANKLTYFLFENRKGYCAYFAGATLFMLRALGIPSRIAVGFATVDRSSKNPGWYWFYEDQAHAWVQVYFPGYGWIDFDTTIPDINAQESPQPDGTPPLNMQQAYFVGDGIVTSVDTVTKHLQLNITKLLYHDKDYATVKPVTVDVDATVATVSTDTGKVNFSFIKKGAHITAASYAEVFKNLNATETDSLLSIIKKIPSPVPVDEIKIFDDEAKEAKAKKQAAAAANPVDWFKVFLITLIIILAIVVLIFISPWLIMQYFGIAAKNSKTDKAKAFNSYRAAMFYLNQLGYFRTNLGPQAYAAMIDTQFSTNFATFTNVYQKIKYSSFALTEKEATIVTAFYPAIIKDVKKQVAFKTRASRFLNIYNTIHYFSQPKIS